jgi:hypothetical protein
MMKRLLGFSRHQNGRSLVTKAAAPATIVAVLLTLQVLTHYYYREQNNAMLLPPTLVNEKTGSYETLGNSESAASLPRWLEAYVESQMNATSPLYLRYRCQSGCGGTGDRISGIIQAFYMAMCTNRAFYIDWKLPVPLDGFFEPNLIQWNQVPQNQAGMNIYTIDSTENKYVRDPYLMPHVSIDIQINLWLEEDIVKEQSCVKDYLTKHGVVDTSQQLDLYRHAFNALFRPTPLLTQSVRQVQKTLSLDSAYIAIHIRTGRGKNFVDPLMAANNESTWPRYLQCAHFFRDALKEPNIQLFLTADTEAAKTELHAMDASIQTRETEIFHIDRTQISQLVNERQAYLDVFVDVQLLVEATCLVMSPSKFSRLGAWLSPQQPRCALLWDECTQETVQHVVAGVAGKL